MFGVTATQRAATAFRQCLGLTLWLLQKQFRSLILSLICLLQVLCL